MVIRVSVLGAVFVLVGLLAVEFGAAQPKPSRSRYPLRDFDNFGCMSKGRVQDCSGTVMQQILADGKGAIPILISQLTESALTKKQIADYWSATRTGDVAFTVLNDLFTRADYVTFEMPGVPDWTAVMKGCDGAAEDCWYRFLRKHGRGFAQRAWMRAWSAHKDQIYWDPKELCFRVPKKPNLEPQAN